MAILWIGQRVFVNCSSRICHYGSLLAVLVCLIWVSVALLYVLLMITRLIIELGGVLALLI